MTFLEKWWLAWLRQDRPGCSMITTSNLEDDLWIWNMWHISGWNFEFDFTCYQPRSKVALSPWASPCTTRSWRTLPTLVNDCGEEIGEQLGLPIHLKVQALHDRDFAWQTIQMYHQLSVKWTFSPGRNSDISWAHLGTVWGRYWEAYQLASTDDASSCVRQCQICEKSSRTEVLHVWVEPLSRPGLIKMSARNRRHLHFLSWCFLWSTWFTVYTQTEKRGC